MNNRKLRLYLCKLVVKYMESSYLEDIDDISDDIVRQNVFCLNLILENNNIVDAYKFIAQL